MCGLKWSPDNQYLASGGNDNKLFVWNTNSTQPVHTYTEHIAAVKAIAWSPHHHGLLASGGGTADRCIRFWNTLTGQPMQSVDTGSQVCNLAWSKHASELVRQVQFNSFHEQPLTRSFRSPLTATLRTRSWFGSTPRWCRWPS